VHGIGIARVEAASDARGLDDVEQRIVVADLKDAEALAHIGIQIDLVRHRDLLIPGAFPAYGIKFQTMIR
jgi:hypothetical protein